jgi:mono/diheme cytochrome c family protein
MPSSSLIRAAGGESWPTLHLVVAGFAALLLASPGRADQTAFHDAPFSVIALANPYGGEAAAVAADRAPYVVHCASCHGGSADGTGNSPPLASSLVQKATDGAVLWLITTGAVDSGMPAWSSLPDQERWQLVTYLMSLTSAPAPATPPADLSTASVLGPRPPAPFTAFRYEVPGTVRKITVGDLPGPYAARSAGNAPTMVSRPPGAWPKAPDGFTVGLYADGLEAPRVIRAAPNGDIFVAESSGGRVRVFRGITAHGKPERSAVFADRLSAARITVAHHSIGAVERASSVSTTRVSARTRTR